MIPKLILIDLIFVAFCAIICRRISKARPARHLNALEEPPLWQLFATIGACGLVMLPPLLAIWIWINV